MKASDTPPPVDDDFPFYNGRPTTVTAAQWWLVMLSVALAFFILSGPIPVMVNQVGGFLRAILYIVIPLAVLGWVSSGHWKAVFRKLRPRDFLVMAGFAILNLIISVLVGSIILKVFGAEVNPMVAGLPEQGESDRILFFARTFFQLIGEEVMTMLPFLAILYFAFSRMKWSRRNAVIAAYLASAILFGLLHLPSYNWNWIQCLLVIGTARLVLTIPYLITKNLWVSAGAHILNDWLIFGFTLFATLRAAS